MFRVSDSNHSLPKTYLPTLATVVTVVTVVTFVTVATVVTVVTVMEVVTVVTKVTKKLIFSTQKKLSSPKTVFTKKNWFHQKLFSPKISM